MRLGTVFHILGQVIIFIGVSMVGPLIWTVYFEESVLPFLLPMGVTIAIGTLLYRYVQPSGDIRQREAFAIVTFSWLGATMLGLLPYLISGTFVSFSDAFFETMSGFSTTGASVLLDIEGTSRGILFWRSLTHWLGGMGIMALFVAALSQVGTGGMQMFRAEVPGPSAEKIKPRIKETAKILWFTYLIISASQCIALKLSGLSLYEAMIHTFGTMATGGFSSRALSVGAFDTTVQWVIIFFMFLAGINFSFYYQALKGKNPLLFFFSQEFRMYLGITLIGTFVIFLILIHNSTGSSFTDAVFQTVSIITTTGYATVDFDLWPGVARGFLVLFMFIGGSAGSTAGSMKVGRHLLLLKSSLLEMRQLIRPRAVLSLKIDGKPLSSRTMVNVLQFFFLYTFITAVSFLILLTSGVDMITAFTSVAATLGNIGPGLNSIGPMENYQFYDPFYKIYMSFLMLIGRLEIYTVLTLLIPSIWKR